MNDVVLFVSAILALFSLPLAVRLAKWRANQIMRERYGWSDTDFQAQAAHVKWMIEQDKNKK